MKNKLLRNVLICICAIILLVSGIYLALGFYYKQGFMMNTWVNDVYCTGKNVEEVNKELLTSAKAPFLKIRNIDGEVYEIKPDDLRYQVDYTEQLNELFIKQKAHYWPVYLVDVTEETMAPYITLDAESIQAEVGAFSFVKEEAACSKDRKIEKTEEGYVLKDTLKNRLDEAIMYDYINLCLKDEAFLRSGYEAGEYLIDLADADCYKDVTPNAAQQAVAEQWKILEEYVDCGIVYDMGDEMISLAGKVASDFIAVDESGEIIFDQEGQPKINEESIEMFINSLADEYNTWKTDLTFTSTAGEEKTVPYVNYGTQIDVDREIAYLKEAFSARRSEVHIPAYKREGYARGKNDIGDTYIEVDMGNQKLYAYLDGQLLVETDIVTGNVKRKMSTPEGVVYVYKKQRNRTLRGPGYASFVKYWMPVKGGIGLHDASWRKKFGGEIYKTDGSHGCINIPREVMADIYDNFEVGTPVIMFY